MTMMNAPMPLTDASERAETWRKSIPAQVFLNHYFAIDYHIRQQNDLFDLAQFPLFDGFRPLVSAEARQQLEKLLLNAWSAEYALRITPIINDTTAESSQYLQSSLH
jgi:hypothetical protein